MHLDLRYNGILWCDDDLAIICETWYDTRTSRWWTFKPKDCIDSPP